MTEEKPESYFIKKEIRRIDTAFERIWQAIEDGIAPPGGRERTTELKRQRAELEARLRVAEQSEALKPSVGDVLLWLDDLANDTTPLEILNEFVRFVEIDGKDVTVYFMFDELPDDFTPKQKKAEHPCYQRCSTNSLMVEARRIELRSILHHPSGSTSLFRGRDSNRRSLRTRVVGSSPFDLSQSHTGYVL